MWFTAEILFKSIHTPPTEHDPIWEERIVIFRADTKEEAMQKATNFGKSQEHNYKNSAGEKIEWQFDSIPRLYQLEADKLEDGLEIFCRFLRHSEIISLKTPFED